MIIFSNKCIMTWTKFMYNFMDFLVLFSDQNLSFTMIIYLTFSEIFYYINYETLLLIVSQTTSMLSSKYIIFTVLKLFGKRI